MQIIPKYDDKSRGAWVGVPSSISPLGPSFHLLFVFESTVPKP